ncbi:WD40-repeat protein, partial [Thalassiosira pseudonana CCMP1335]
VYCLKFDRTGRYFVTGADDQLVKLFHLGAGAVLVCSLRGHAGVVSDIDVSVDNALLATASADGDVRVWGLRDGCPVAILRGHKDGANMVSLDLQYMNPGDFIANDSIDEGVTLIAQMQHGNVVNENQQQGVGTRAKRKTVKVMCIARCPIGGHFATGSDDGIGRVERLLVLLQGHNNAITDMKYSSAGDRLLTASMKDGVVRVWSWGKESPIVIDGIPSIIANNEQQAKTTAHKFFNLSQVLIRLTPIGQGETTTPGSQMIYVWDSQSGKCLMGIASSHTSLCSTLVTHPFLPSVVATAGADGVINVWDLDRGERFFTHKNSLLHGPMPTDSTESRGKHCGYLEGQFSPDGLFLIVSDEAGRVTIFDTLLPSKDHGSKNLSLSAPSFMKEQYFANDYYELFYDANGYCIERGSEQPPHLAP